MELRPALTGKRRSTFKGTDWRQKLHAGRFFEGHCWGAGIDTPEGKGQTSWGEGHRNARQAQEGLVAPKGALGLSPKVVLERPGPRLFMLMDYTPPGKACDLGQGRAANHGNAQRQTHQPATLPAPGMNRPSVLSPAVIKGATTRSLNPHSVGSANSLSTGQPCRDRYMW